MPAAQTPGSRSVILAIAAASAAAALAGVDAIIVRMLAGNVHPFVIGFFRSLCGLITILPWIALRPSILKTGHLFRHASRATIKLLSLVCGFAAFAAAPLADVQAIMFTAPMFVMLGAWIMLGERLTALRVVAIILSMAGAIIIIGPDSGGVSIALLLAVAAAALQALVQLMLKRMSHSDPVETLVAWNLIMTVPIALVPAALFWTTPTLAECGLLLLQGALGAANMSLMTKAFSLAEASHVAPVDFLRLPFVAVLAWIMFGEVAGLSTWIGACLVCMSAMLPVIGMIFRNHMNK